MDGDAARMAGAPDLDEIQRLGAAHLARTTTVIRRRAWRSAPARSWTRRPARVRSGTWSRAAHCNSTVSSEHQHRGRRWRRFGEQGIGERGLAAAGVAPAIRTFWRSRRTSPPVQPSSCRLRCSASSGITPMARLRSAKAGPGAVGGKMPRSVRWFRAVRRTAWLAGRDAPPRRRGRPQADDSLAIGSGQFRRPSARPDDRRSPKVRSGIEA